LQSKTTHTNFVKFHVCVTCGGGFVFLRQQCNALLICSFVDDVMFSHNAANAD